MKLILARNRNEARTVMNDGDKYLAVLPDDLMGFRDVELVVIGNFWARGDYKPEEIFYYCKSHNITLPPEITSQVRG